MVAPAPLFNRYTAGLGFLPSKYISLSVEIYLPVALDVAAQCFYKEFSSDG